MAITVKLTRLVRFLLRVVGVVIVIIATIMLVRAFDSLRQPDLQAWHKTRFAEEFHVDDLKKVSTFDDYLRMEDAAFKELEARVIPAGKAFGGDLLRYNPDSPSWPGSFSQDWNRSFEMRPDRPWGGIVLVHGLTDAPYSMLAMARLFRDHGLYVLSARMPGHGLAPSALLEATRRDWLAVVTLAVKHARDQIGPDAPLLVGGYSNGGALVVKYTADALLDDSLELPDQLYLFSPAIGITGFARVASWHRLLAAIPFFEKFRWEPVLPEYDPFKYNSFPKIAGHESWALARELDTQLQSLQRSGDLERMPPILAFQSLADSTVLTESLVSRLFDRLVVPNSELVIFDINRLRAIEELVTHRYDGLLERIEASSRVGYSLTVVANESPESRSVVARKSLPGGGQVDPRPLGLEWPRDVYSMTHVAIPFRPDDLIYGDPWQRSPGLGSATPRGENRVLTIPVMLLMRLRHNPFYSYMEERVVDFLNPLRPAQASAAAAD